MNRGRLCFNNLRFGLAYHRLPPRRGTTPPQQGRVFRPPGSLRLASTNRLHPAVVRRRVPIRRPPLPSSWTVTSTTSLKRNVLDDPRGVKAVFNRRFHDYGFKGRRFIFFDTLATRKMGKRGSGRHRLHFHAIFELPVGWTRADLQRLLEKIFGKAAPMGQRQFHFSKPNWNQHYTLRTRFR